MKKYKKVFLQLLIFMLTMNLGYYTYAEDEENKEEKIAYLTFDDGPSLNTEKVLKILRENDVKATFFVVGPLKEEDAKYVKQAYDEGNAIGNHTYDHDFEDIYISEKAFWDNFKKDQEFIKSMTGEESTLFRFPGGSFNRDVKRRNGKQFNEKIISKFNEMGISYYDWNVDSGDGMSDHNSSSTLYNNIMKEAKGKNKIIILMHDSKGKKSTVEVLPSVIKAFKEQGYKFDTLKNYKK